MGQKGAIQKVLSSIYKLPPPAPTINGRAELLSAFGKRSFILNSKLLLPSQLPPTVNNASRHLKGRFTFFGKNYRIMSNKCSTFVEDLSNTCRTLVEQLQKVSLMSHEGYQHLTCLSPPSRPTLYTYLDSPFKSHYL